MDQFELISLIILFYILPSVGCLLYCYSKDVEVGYHRTKRAVFTDSIVSLLPLLNLVVYFMIVYSGIKKYKRKGTYNGNVGKTVSKKRI